jgi:hypothetical protein
MPKRRITPARRAAIVKWQKAGANARKSNGRKVIPRTEYGTKLNRGPMIDLYHVTTESNAKAIRKNGFQWDANRSLMMKGVKDPIWFSRKPPKPGSDAGDWVHEKFGGKKVKTALFTVRVRYRKTFADKHVPSNSKSIPSRVVSAEYLRGKKIREIK